MLKKIKSTVMALVVVGLLATPVLAIPQTVYADFAGSRKAACEGIGLSGGNCTNGADNRVQNLLNTIVNILTAVVGIAAVIMIIVAGFKYVTSGGDSNKVSSAKTTLIYALAGLIIVALAQFIVKFVLKQV